MRTRSVSRLMNAGIVATALGDYQEALEYAERALEAEMSKARPDDEVVDDLESVASGLRRRLADPSSAETVSP